MTSLNDITSLTRLYADARGALANEVVKLNAEIEILKRERLPEIKRLVGRAAEREDVLKRAIEGSPELFVQPRTIIAHGIRVGLRKGSGSVEWDDVDKVCELIEKHFPAQKDLLIKTTKKPVKKALLELSVAELKKIGCTAEETGDVVVIKPTDGQVEKLISALLKDAAEDTEEKEAA
jgi:hypothetical protein